MKMIAEKYINDLIDDGGECDGVELTNILTILDDEKWNWFFRKMSSDEIESIIVKLDMVLGLSIGKSEKKFWSKLKSGAERMLQK